MSENLPGIGGVGGKKGVDTLVSKATRSSSRSTQPRNGYQQLSFLGSTSCSVVPLGAKRADSSRVACSQAIFVRSSVPRPQTLCAGSWPRASIRAGAHPEKISPIPASSKSHARHGRVRRSGRSAPKASRWCETSGWWGGTSSPCRLERAQTCKHDAANKLRSVLSKLSRSHSIRTTSDAAHSQCEAPMRVCLCVSMSRRHAGYWLLRAPLERKKKGEGTRRRPTGHGAQHQRPAALLL